MKKIKLTSLLFAAIALFFTSCSVEKRVYNSGYHIDWFSSKKTKENENLNSYAQKKAEKEKRTLLTFEEFSSDNENLEKNNEVNSEILSLASGLDNIYLKQSSIALNKNLKVLSLSNELWASLTKIKTKEGLRKPMG